MSIESAINYMTIDTNNLITPMNEEELLKKLENSKNHADQGYIKDADEMIQEMRSKYKI